MKQVTDAELRAQEAERTSAAETAKRQELQAQAEKARDDALESKTAAQRAQMGQAVSDHRAKMMQLSKQYEQPAGHQYTTVSLTNQCNVSKIYVAITYQDLSDVWVTEGWWNVESGKTVTPNIMTRNRNIYFFAEGGGKEWNGNEDGQSYNSVIQWRFIRRGTEAIEGPRKRDVSFFPRNAGENWTQYKMPFTCN